MGVNITCDRCGKIITHDDYLELEISKPENTRSGKGPALNQVIYLCDEHKKELLRSIERFIKAYMERKKT